MSFTFQGTITKVFPARTGTTEKGDWASVEFEVTESNPENAQYPQIGKFDIFKNGENIKYAKDFQSYTPPGTEVEVEFNLKKNEYTNKSGELVGFYKTSAWKISKVEGGSKPAPFQPAPASEEDEDPLPF